MKFQVTKPRFTDNCLAVKKTEEKNVHRFLILSRRVTLLILTHLLEEFRLHLIRHFLTLG